MMHVPSVLADTHSVSFFLSLMHVTDPLCSFNATTILLVILAPFIVNPSFISQILTYSINSIQDFTVLVHQKEKNTSVTMAGSTNLSLSPTTDNLVTVAGECQSSYTFVMSILNGVHQLSRLWEKSPYFSIIPSCKYGIKHLP